MSATAETTTGFDRDAYWALYERFMRADESGEALRAEVDGLVGLLGIEDTPGVDVLDLGCGTGRHTVELARRGYRMTGLDRTARYVERARERAETEGVACGFGVADMRGSFGRGVFDAAICVYNPVGAIGGREADLGLVRSLRAALRPGGALVIDVVGAELVRRDFEAETRHVSPPDADGSRLVMVQTTEVVGDFEAVVYERRFEGEGIGETFRMRVELYTGASFAELLREAGFGSAAVHGDHAGGSYDGSARRLVGVAR